MQNKDKVAFFDIDGTLFRWSLFLGYTHLMMQKGFLPDDVHKELLVAKKRWQDREGEFSEYVNMAIDIFESNISGVSVDDFLNCVQEVVDTYGRRTYVYTRELIQELKSQGYKIIAISHSAKLALDIFCPRYGFDKTYGYMYEIENGKFTGKIMHGDITDKGQIIRRAVEKENLSLKDSYAVGDTNSDIAMLKMVENPIAFNPNMTLYQETKKQGWKMVVERKDVIYNIQNGKKTNKQQTI